MHEAEEEKMEQESLLAIRMRCQVIWYGRGRYIGMTTNIIWNNRHEPVKKYIRTRIEDKLKR